jgi:hypothetical protein
MPHGASCRGILAGQPHAGRGVPGGAALLCPAASCRRAATRRRTTHACRVLARASCPRVPPALFRDGGEAYTPADEPNVRGCQLKDHATARSSQRIGALTLPLL